jgi:deoxyribodipyrimidine photo-lyase
MSPSSDRPAVIWFRRDLRVHDHPALAAGIAAHPTVVPLFVVDEALVHGRWPAPNRLWSMLGSLRALADELEARGGRLIVRTGRPEEVVPAVAAAVGSLDVYVSRDHAPYGRARDRRVAERLGAIGAALHARPGVLIQEPEAVHLADGRPPVVFGAFRRAWRQLPVRAVLPAPERIPWPVALDEAALHGPALHEPAPDEAIGGRAGPAIVGRIPSLHDLGIAGPTADPALLPAPGERAARRRLEAWLATGPGGLDAYAARRDRLDLEGTSRLSADLRWGTLSPVEVLARSAGDGDGARAFATELAWRDFYAHVLWHRPAVRTAAFRPAFDAVPWRDDPAAIEAWRAGRTGYPLVDAAMRQLIATGWMPNRGRMVVASFLTKHLLVDWRVGERHFMAHLCDGDLASNNGGWQWTASTGTDPQPYFRVFDPVAQGRRHDPEGTYVRRWVPELRDVPAGHIHAPWLMPRDLQLAAGCRVGEEYPAPIVEHRLARDRALEAYRGARAAALPSASGRRVGSRGADRAG